MSAASSSDVEKDESGTERGPDHQEFPHHELVEAAEAVPFTVHDDPKAADGHDSGRDASLKKVETSNSVSNINSVPNGGLRAWLQVMASFFIFFNTWGLVNSFGIYQTYYESGALFTASASDISWIGSIQGFLLMFVSSLAGPVYDAGYVRQLIAVGSFLIVFGLMMLGLCTTYWQVFLAQSLCIGIGTGCLFVTGVAIISTYFSTRMALAVGVAATGSSIGGMLYPIIFDQLQPRIGFGWATRVLGFIALATLCITNVFTRVRVVPSSRRKFLDLRAWTELPYLFFNLGMFLGFVGLYTVFFYVQAYVLDTHIMGANLSFYLLTILNAASTFGRFLPNYVADRLGPLNIIVPCSFCTSLICFCLIAAHSSAGVIVLVIFYGFFSGTFVSLPPTIIVHLSRDKRHLIGTRMGMGFAVASVGLVVGTPVAGAILDATGRYADVWLFGGLFTLAGAICILIARHQVAGWDLWAKA